MIDRLQSHLDPIARDNQRWQLWRALAGCWAVCALIGLLLRAAAFHRSLLEFCGLLALAVIASGVILFRFRRTPPDYLALAREIERENPQLHSLLLTAVEQAPSSPGGELNYLQQRVVAEAVAYARTSPWGQRNAHRRALAFGSHWALLAIFLISLAALWPAKPKAGDIWAEAERSGGVAVSPGDTNLERGSGLVVMARFEGRLPADATLVIQSPNANEQRLALTKNLSDPVFGGAIPEVKTDFKYHIEYSGHTTRDYKVGVFDYPRLDHADAKLTYPAFTGLPEKTIQDTRRISAVEGSTLDYSFFLNKHVASATLVSTKKPVVVNGKILNAETGASSTLDGATLSTNKSVIPLTTDAANATIYHSHFILDQSQRYELLLVDDAGRTNRIPPEFVIDALKNRPAELKIVTPRGDIRVSPLEEVPFQAEVSGDFGVRSYGIAYQLGDGETKTVELGGKTAAREKKQFNYLLPLENLGAQPDELLSYYVWADDTASDGTVRRTASDLFFAEIRPFDQIFREGQSPDANNNNNQNGGNQNGGGGGQGSPSEKLTDLEKDIMTATWNLKRREASPSPSAKYKEDAGVVHDSQGQALQQAQSLVEKTQDARLKTFAEAAQKAMEKANAQLAEATDKNSVKPLTTALSDEQSAYQALLKLQAREYQVARNNRSQRQQRGGQRGGAQQREQEEADQLDLKQTENRYETEHEATAQQTPEQKESVQVASRLKELAQRQQGLNDKLKELQTALQEAKTDPEREDIKDRLKRLREEQQDLLADVDELRQRMDRPENQSRMSDARQQLDKTRSEVQRAEQALNQESVPQALASGTRAQRDLQQLQQDFRKQNSSQFAEEMRQMRDNARQMAQKQEDIAKKLDDFADPKHKTLSDSDERRDVASQLASQEDALTNIFTQMRQVSEQSETAEPLLSKELYDILRTNKQDSLKNVLDYSAELVRRGFVPQASQAQQKAREQVNQLKTDVEHAAESVLGDDTEALRLAKKELQQLSDELDQEVAQANENRQTNAAGGSANGNEGQPGSGQRAGRGAGSNEVQQASGERGNQQASAGQRNGGERNGQQNGGEQNGQQGSGERRDQQASAGQRNGGERNGQAGGGQRPGGNSNEVAQASGQRGGQQGAGGRRPGQGQGGQGNQDSQQTSEDQNQQAQQADNQAGNGGNGRRGQNQQGQRGGQGGAGGQPGGEQTAQNQAGERNGGRNGERNANDAQRNGGIGGWRGGGEYNGPLVGENFVNWSDRLRNVEEMIDSPDLQSQVAQIRDRARIVRQEYKRTGARPDWADVRTKIATPLAEVRDRVNEELARRESKEALVPLDRDPVPVQFTERVKRYYEQLGKNE